MSRFSYIILLICMIILIGYIGQTVYNNPTWASSVEASLTAALVFVTAGYLFATQDIVHQTKKQVEAANQQATAANKQVQIMLEAQFTTVAPVVSLNISSTSYDERFTTFNIRIRNVGTGPAINFRCWIEDPRHREFRSQRNAITCGVIAQSDDDLRPMVISIPNYKLGESYIRAQYESIFGKEKTYESCLMFSENAFPELKYGEVKDPNEMVIL